MKNKRLTIDELASNELYENKRKEESEAVKAELLEFIKKEKPAEVDAYEFKKDEILIEVFTKNFGDSDSELTSRKIRHFSIAKILAAGPDVEDYAVGDIVKLRDSDTASVESSKYRDFAKSEMANSNLKQSGAEPPRFLSNIYEKYGKYAFILKPLDLDEIDGKVDRNIYKVPSGFIENKIINIDLIL